MKRRLVPADQRRSDAGLGHAFGIRTVRGSAASTQQGRHCKHRRGARTELLHGDSDFLESSVASWTQGEVTTECPSATPLYTRREIVALTSNELFLVGSSACSKVRRPTSRVSDMEDADHVPIDVEQDSIDVRSTA